MRRREFLEATTTLAITAALGPQVAHAAHAAHAAPGSIGVAAEEAAILAGRVLQAYPPRRSLEAIGDAFSKEAATGALTRQTHLPDAIQGFLSHLGLSERKLWRMPPAAIRARIKIETARDFSEGRIVRVRGWLLGETEARLCAIAALCTA